MKIFVTGGAGYIGSHTVHVLVRSGHEVVIYDNLTSGHRNSVPSKVTLIEGDVTDKSKLNFALKSERPDMIVHFAALIEVEESIRVPMKYYENNLYGTLCLLEACDKNRIGNVVFSSTAAVYGEASSITLTEGSPKNPINPYGHSKLMSEKLIQDFSSANSWFRFVILRYFNVAGAQIDLNSGVASLKIGQFRERATHLITLAARAAVTNGEVKIFGTDYPTIDGTCVRDYIHVDDLANAHLKALEYLSGGNASDVFNCGYGDGYSVKQVLEAMKEVSGVNFKIEAAGRRPGDSPSLIANSNHAREILAWKPQFNKLGLICRSAYDWEIVRERLKKESESRI